MKVSIPILVEGKYDKIKLASVLDAQILTTDGFGIFKKEETARFLRRLAAARGMIVLTDSDAAGLVIRNFLRNILPAEKVIHLYAPRIEGCEKRKSVPSKEGILGVEGMDTAWVLTALSPFADEKNDTTHKLSELSLTKVDFYEQGLSGRTDSAVRRRVLAGILSLPENLSANALLEAVNLLITRDEWEAALNKINNRKGTES